MTITVVTMIVVCAMLAASNRYAGVGEKFGKLVFGSSVCIACGLLGQPLIVCLSSGLLAFAARQYISHGVVVGVGPRQRGPWWGVCFTRVALITAPLGAAPFYFIPFSAAAATACLGASLFARKLEMEGKIPDMLEVAEPLQGLCYGMALCGLSVL